MRTVVQMEESDEEANGSYLSDASEFDNGSDVFEASLVKESFSAFSVLAPTDCLELAQTEISFIAEIFCCTQSAAQVLVRHFRWNRDKLTEGVHPP